MDGEIAPSDLDRLESHLEGCEACRAEKRLWWRIREVIREEEAAVGSDSALRVLDGLRGSEANRILPFVRRTAAAAVLLVLGSIVTLLALPSTPATPPLASRADTLGRALILDQATEPALGLVDDKSGDSK
jgi:anti-sigma factor RsiW